MASSGQPTKPTIVELPPARPRPEAQPNAGQRRAEGEFAHNEARVRQDEAARRAPRTANPPNRW